MTEKHEADYTSYWRVNSGYSLPKRLRTKPITCEFKVLKPSKFMYGKKATQIIVDTV